MDNFKDKTAFISGGASGIGLATAQSLLGEGMKVAIADIRQDALDRAVKTLDGGDKVLALKLDVTDRADWVRAADAAEAKLGKIALLFSNAGVFLGGPTQDATYDDWDFCLGVNLGGTINAVRTVVPRMIAAGAGGHVILTSSINGLFQSGGAGVYTASKFATTGIGESLRANLEPHGIGVSLLCPGPVRTGLFASTPQVRPAHLKEAGAYMVQLDETDPTSQEIFATAMSSEEVADKVLKGVKANDLYIITHGEIRHVLEERAKAILSSLPSEVIPPERAKGARTLYDDAVYRNAVGGRK